METNFLTCVTFTLAQEGGFTQDPRDPGGATNLGITLATLSAYRGETCTADDVKALAMDEAEDIYHANYWRPTRGDALPSGLDLMNFDFGVNAGPMCANRILQEALGVTADGTIGPETLGAAQRCDPLAVLPKMASLQGGHYKQLANYAVFGKGWDARTDRRLARALQMAS